MRNDPGYDADVVRPCFFAEFLFDSGILRLNSADRDIPHEGNIYTGVGQLGEISEYSTTVGTQATALRFTLMSLPPSIVARLSNENERRKPVKAFLVLLNPDYTLAGVPRMWFNGTVDSMVISVGKTAAVSVTATSRLINWARSANTRYSNEDQQARYPDDNGLKFLVGLPTAKIQWGS